MIFRLLSYTSPDEDLIEGNGYIPSRRRFPGIQVNYGHIFSYFQTFSVALYPDR